VLFNSNVQANYLELGNGNGQTPASYGIVLQASAGSLPSSAGWYEWVQLISVDHVQYIDSTGRHTCQPKAWTGQPQLDTSFPYTSGPTSQQTGSVTDDSPKSPLGGETAQNFGATTYLMWDPAIPPTGQTNCTPATVTTSGVSTPSSCSSIPVPLGYVTWSWTGDAIDTLSPTTGDNGTTGHLLCGAMSGQASSFALSSSYPTWIASLPSGASLSQAFSCAAE